eukprot:10670647-Karenia_brevis.AAC.1
MDDGDDEYENGTHDDHDGDDDGDGHHDKHGDEHENGNVDDGHDASSSIITIINTCISIMLII